MSRESYPNLIDNLAIVKGETYRKLIESGGITFPGDLTTATLRGQIRDNYVEKGGVLLGTFSFEESTYDAEGDITRIYPYLTEFATVNLPATLKYVEGREPNIKTNPVYDIELFINDEIIKKKPAFLQIVGEVTGGEVTFNPAEEWTAGIASVELIATVGFTKTYQIWGDEAKTVSLGTFDVIDTQPTEGVSGFLPNISVTQEGEWIVDTELDLSPLATEETLTTIASNIDELVVVDGKLQVDANVSLPNVYDVQLSNNGVTQLEDLTIKVVEQNPLSFDGLASEYNQTVLNGKIPDGLTVTGGKLLVDAAVELPSIYDIQGTVELGSTSLSALENITAEIDTTGLATDTKLEEINDKLPSNLTVVDNKLQVDANVTLPNSYDVTGTVSIDNFPTTQPVSIASFPPLATGTNTIGGITNTTFAATQSGSWSVGITNASIAVTGNFYPATQPVSLTSLPAFASTPTFNIGTAPNLTITNTLFAATQSGSWTVGVNNYPATQTVNGTVTANLGTIGSIATTTNQEVTNTRLGDVTETAPTTDTASSGLNGRLQRIAQRISSLIGLLPTSLGVKTAANSLAVTLATDGVAADLSTKVGEVQGSPTANTVLDRLKTIATLLSGTIRNSPVVASTPTLNNVASSASSVTLLAANTNRKTAIIVNDSTAILYVKFDASAASTTSYTLTIPPITNSIPSFTTLSGSDYAGEIRGIWSAANGFARITEVV